MMKHAYLDALHWGGHCGIHKIDPREKITHASGEPADWLIATEPIHTAHKIKSADFNSSWNTNYPRKQLWGGGGGGECVELAGAMPCVLPVTQI